METDQKIGCIFLIGFVIVMIIWGIISYHYHYNDPHWEEITVTEKNVNPGKGEKWLVYSKDEVYCITDLIFIGFFESSDVYNKIEAGKTYRVYVSGSRLPILSYYKCIRNAIEIEEKINGM